MTSFSNTLQLATIHCKNFRCFDSFTLDLDDSIVFMYGPNGAGKTTLLEALYYGCYLRSFRTHNVRELIALTKDSFFIKLVVHDYSSLTPIDHTITIGFSDNKRLVKINDNATVTYKDLFSCYRVISVTEDDLSLIKGSPEERRAFIDKALFVYNPSFVSIMKEYKIILDNRNALLKSNSCSQDLYIIWTQKLLQATHNLQKIRTDMLNQFQVSINKLLTDCFDEEITLAFNYQPKKGSTISYQEFMAKNYTLLADELTFKRSLFGAHLDDFTIVLEGKNARSYASRGQQKLIVMLIKAAQIIQLTQNKGSVVFLLDDFMTDFDNKRSQLLLLMLLNLNCQLIFTSPSVNQTLESALKALDRSYKIVEL